MHIKVITSASATREHVQTFFCRDVNSKATAGVRETITKDGQAKQKRYLIKSMYALCTAFTAVNFAMVISVSSFTRLKPFWVKRPKIHERQTCLCKQHENIQYLHSKLKELVQVSSTTFEETVKTVSVVCDVKAKDCMYSECGQCRRRLFHTYLMTTINRWSGGGSKKQLWKRTRIKLCI